MNHEVLSALDTCHSDYIGLPKYMGSVEPAELLALADLNAKRADAMTNTAASRFHSVAGSAYVEAVLTTPYTAETADIGLGYLDDAELHLRKAADGEYQLLENGVYNPNDQDDWMRAELQVDFMDVYRDIVRHNVTEQTKNELIEKLQHRVRYVKVLKDMGQSDVGGLLGELDLLLQIWKTHRNPTDIVVFPSTIRGGEGTRRPRETHDVVFGTFADNGQWSFVGSEIKKGNKVDSSHLVRYSHPIIKMGKTGIKFIYDSIAVPK